jgi:hypothetical protein
MISEDYYKILEVSDTATQADIKKSYRRLAMKYHPDKNFESKVAELKFKIIQEAYHTLSNHKRRQQYNHIQYDQKHGLNKKPTYTFNSTDAILKKILQLKNKVQLMDPHRLNTDALFSSIQKILSPANIRVITSSTDEKITTKIIDEVLHVSTFLQYQQAKQIYIQLATIANTDNALHEKIYSFQKQQKLNSRWDSYHPFVAIISAIIFCLLIYLISR